MTDIQHEQAKWSKEQMDQRWSENVARLNQERIEFERRLRNGPHPSKVMSGETFVGVILFGLFTWLFGGWLLG